MKNRNRLPNRREHEIYEFNWNGLNFVAGVSRFDNGRLAEIFMHRAGKPGSSSEAFGGDCAVAASLALQHGATISALKQSLPKRCNGDGAGPLGRLLDLLEDREGSNSPR